MKDFFRRPLGLALSAGGVHGAWQAAALRTLEAEGGFVFDAVLGLSAGALTGSHYFLGLMDQAVASWESVDGGVLRFSPRLFPLSIFSDRPIWESVSYARDDEDAKRKARCRLVVVTARFQRDRPLYAVFTPRGKEGWDGPLAAQLVASCSIPIVFPPARLPYRGGEQTLLDGGVPCEEPMSFTALAGCRDVLVLEMVRPEEMGASRRGILQGVDQKARETVRRLIDQGVSSLRQGADPPRIFRLAPSRTLEFMQLSFGKKEIHRGLEQGAADARRFMSRPADYLYPPP